MVRRSSSPQLVVRSLSAAARTGVASIGALRFPCALGRSGRRAVKREGDGASPIGRWPARQVFYRPDRIARPMTGLPVRRIAPSDGWCDAPHDRNYNRRVRLPYAASAEEMWRGDGLYDLVVELGYNDRPRRRGCGSAIFMHVAREGYEPTAGCVALERVHLLRLLRRMRTGTHVIIPA